MGYKILSLDGGGSWAMIQARVLQDLYKDAPGHELLKNFDLVIGNSGGSLVLAALCVGLRPSQIVSIFENEEERKLIFSRLAPDEHNLLSLLRKMIPNFSIGPRYDARDKRTGLVKVLESHDELHKNGLLPSIVNTPLNQLPKIIGEGCPDIIITGFDYFKERVTFFRSNEKSLTNKFAAKYYQITLGDAIHASSNAPVNYFNEYAQVDLRCVQENMQEKKRNWYWDGAVAGFNNPVLAGLIEAITNNPGMPLSEFKILSLGTGQKGKAIIVDQKYSEGNPDITKRYQLNKDKPYVASDDSTKFKLEISKLAQSILSDPPDSATFISYSILDRQLNNSGNFVRINPCIMPWLDVNTQHYLPPTAYADDEETFMKILDLEMDAVEDEEVALIKTVADKFIIDDDGPCLPNQMIRDEGKDGMVLGFGKYWEAKGRWGEIEGDEA
ncbi:MAG: patatin-like phospholipase family protein [Bacteroidota bacterium]